MIFELPPNIHNAVRGILAACPGIQQVWLIGSRANDRATSSSDWDFLAFGDKESLESLKNRNDLDHSIIDFLIVYDGDNFQAPWGNEPKKGSLTKWQWRLDSPGFASYLEIKFIPNAEQDDDSDIRLGQISETRVKAQQVAQM